MGTASRSALEQSTVLVLQVQGAGQAVAGLLEEAGRNRNSREVARATPSPLYTILALTKGGVHRTNQLEMVSFRVVGRVFLSIEMVSKSG